MNYLRFYPIKITPKRDMVEANKNSLMLFKYSLTDNIHPFLRILNFDSTQPSDLQFSVHNCLMFPAIFQQSSRSSLSKQHQ